MRGGQPFRGNDENEDSSYQGHFYKLMRMTELCLTDFLDEVESSLRNQLANYIEDVRDDARFQYLKGIEDLCKQLVATGKHMTYGAVFKLVKFDLILPVATASVERVFSSMKHVKPDPRNKNEDQWLHVRLATFMERDLFFSIDPCEVLEQFQKMGTRRHEL